MQQFIEGIPARNRAPMGDVTSSGNAALDEACDEKF